MGPIVRTNHRLYTVPRHDFHGTIEGVKPSIMATSRNVLFENRDYFPADIVTLRDTPDSIMNPEFEKRKRATRRAEMAIALAGPTIPKFFKMSTDEADLGIRYEFLDLHVVKINEMLAADSGPKFWLGLKKTFYHVLLVSNSRDAWRKSAVCVRTWDEFVWLSEVLRLKCQKPVIGKWPQLFPFGGSSIKRKEKIEEFLQPLVKIPMAQTKIFYSLFFYTNTPTSEINLLLESPNCGEAQINIPKGLQEYEKEVLPKQLSDKEIHKFSALYKENGEYGIDVVADMEDEDTDIFDDLTGYDEADVGARQQLDQSLEEAEEAITVPTGGARPKTRAGNGDTAATRKTSCNAIINKNGGILQSEEEAHHDQILGSYLNVGSVETVRHLRDGSIHVDKSSESPISCRDGDACPAAKKTDERKRSQEVRRTLGARRRSLEQLAFQSRTGATPILRPGLAPPPRVAASCPNPRPVSQSRSYRKYDLSPASVMGNRLFVPTHLDVSRSSSTVNGSGSASRMTSAVSSAASMPPIEEETMGVTTLPPTDHWSRRQRRN